MKSTNSKGSIKHDICVIASGSGAEGSKGTSRYDKEEIIEK